MEASSYDQGENQMNITEGSLNETANSVHFEIGERDKEMEEINPLLQQFITTQLLNVVEFQFEGIESNKLISDPLHIILKPQPSVYFLPSTILYLNQRENLEALQDKIDDLERKDYHVKYDRDRKELNITVHNRLQLLYYNLRTLKTDSKYHRDPEMLDNRHLINKLYEYYEYFYKNLYFKQTSILILYWAYQHDLLNNIISEDALKLIIICIFINFGYGVNNIVNLQSQNPQKLKKYKKMNSFSRINPRGETQIEQELITQFYNYTIQQKRGFYMLTRKKYMQIKDVVPVYFPVLPLLDQQEQNQRKQEIHNSIKGVLDHEREKMSICKNISKIFKFLYNKFQKPMRFVVDFGQKVAYRHQFSENFELEVIHPVLNSSICKLKGSQIKNLKRQIDQIHEKFNKNQQSLQIMYFMLEKGRR